MTRRITRAERVGLETPSIESLQEAFATFQKGLAESGERLDHFSPAHLAEQSYYDQAVEQVGVDLAWTLVLDGADDAPSAREVFRKQLEAVSARRNASIREGWRYEGEREYLAERERFWEAAERDLSRWVSEARRERERMLRGGMGARLGRAVRRFIIPG